MKTKPTTCYQCGEWVPSYECRLKKRHGRLIITGVSVYCKRGHSQPVAIIDE